MTGRDALPTHLRHRHRYGVLHTRIGVASLCVLLAASGAARSQPLAEAVAQALKTNPRVMGAQTAAQAVSHEITGAQSQMNARFGLIIEPGVGYIRGSGNNSAGDLGVQAIKPVYDSGRTDNEVAR